MIGKIIAYEGNGLNGKVTRFAKIETKEFHEGLNKVFYHCISSHGNRFRLSIDEIKFVVH